MILDSSFHTCVLNVIAYIYIYSGCCIYSSWLLSLKCLIGKMKNEGICTCKPWSRMADFGCIIKHWPLCCCPPHWPQSFLRDLNSICLVKRILDWKKEKLWSYSPSKMVFIFANVWTRGYWKRKFLLLSGLWVRKQVKVTFLLLCLWISL